MVFCSTKENKKYVLPITLFENFFSINVDTLQLSTFFFILFTGCDIATSNGGWSIKTLKGVVSEAGAYLEKNMSDILDIAEMSPIKEEEEEEEKDEEDLQEDGEKHEEEGTEKGNLDVLCLSNYFFFQ